MKTLGSIFGPRRSQDLSNALYYRKKSRFMKVLVMETLNKKNSEWGVSFTNHNPDPKDYVRCYSSEDAFKLQKILDSFKK